MSGRLPTGPQSSSTTAGPLYMSYKSSTWPPNYICPDNALEYFCNTANCFYDASSCNQQLRMQNISRPLDECLADMIGIQYVLWSAQPPLYIICKHRRNSPQNVTPLAYYYIINGVISLCPDLLSFVQTRLLGSIDPLKRAFDEVIQYSKYNVAKGYYWEFKNKVAESEEKEEEKALQARSSHFQQTRTSMLMKNLLEMFPHIDAPDPATEVKQEAEDEAMDTSAPGANASSASATATTTNVTTTTSKSTAPSEATSKGSSAVSSGGVEAKSSSSDPPAKKAK
ncbi:unnamed protein product [Auanema sp. JU1783]|nr:unnamed protein product [Auanema sp. JU1783]